MALGLFAGGAVDAGADVLGFGISAEGDFEGIPAWLGAIPGWADAEGFVNLLDACDADAEGPPLGGFEVDDPSAVFEVVFE